MVLDGRAFQADSGRLDELKAMLKPGGKGIVCLSMALEDRGREVEIAMPGRFDISPAQKGAISTVPRRAGGGGYLIYPCKFNA